jgi:hypothetical protein
MAQLPEDTISNSDLLSEEELILQAEEEEKRLQEEERKGQELLKDLAYSIERKFMDRESRRQPKENQWLEAWRLYLPNIEGISRLKGSFNSTKDVYQDNRPDVNIVANKCDIAIAQCESMQFSIGDKNWDLTLAPNAPASQADACELMEREIETQLNDTGYGPACRKAIRDRVIMGAGILKGPVNTGKMRTSYAPVGDGSMWEPKIGVDITPEITCVNPWFFYPDDTVNEFYFVGDSIELHPMSPFELKKLMNHPGYIAQNIEEALKTPPDDYAAHAYSDYANLTTSNPYLFEHKYKVLEYHGPVTMDQLGVIGITPTYDSPNGEYYGEVWSVCGKVIRIELQNIEGCFEIPYCMSTWIKDPSSVFGIGAPLLMRDQQRVVTEAWHMMLDNASVSCGPQVALNKEFIEPANGKWEVNPFAVWYLKDPMMKVQDAIQFFDVPNVSESLRPILDLARMFAEEESRTPMIAAGMESASTQESATGALIMQKASTTLLDQLAEEWDDQVTEKIIRRMYAWNMQYNPKPEIKGDFVVDVRSSTEYKNKQIHLRDIERLSVEASQNEQLGMLINMDALQRVRLTMMNIPYKDVVKTPEEVAKLQQEMANKPNPEMIELQIKQMEAQTAQMEAQLKQQQLEFEKAQQQQREAWEHEEKMAATYARTVEAQAMVVRSQNEKETQMLQIASRAQSDAEKNQILAQIGTMNNETKVFLKSMEETRKNREMLLTQQELEIKKKQGSGI